MCLSPASLVSSFLPEYFVLLEEGARLNCFSPELGQQLPVFPSPSQTMRVSPRLPSSPLPRCINTFYMVRGQALRLLGLTAAMLCILLAESVHTQIESLHPGRHVVCIAVLLYIRSQQEENIKWESIIIQ